MHVQLNSKNVLICSIVVFFVYLAFLIWGGKETYPELDVELRDLISYAVLSVETGGHAVAKIYSESNLNIRKKGDTDVGKAELLTKADLVSNHLILGLLKRFPLVNVVTEEKSEKLSDKDVEKYRDDNYDIWMNVKEALEKFPSEKIDLNRVTMWVDPLDATQEFTEGLTQYITVMSCIAIDGKPIFGAIYRPFFNETFLGMVGFGLLDSKGHKIEPKTNEETAKVIVVSRSHTGTVKEVAEKAFDKGEYVVEPAGGSGYKTLRLLNGTAELYIHTTAIKKWDICAANALINAAGGSLIDLNGKVVDYSYDSDVLHKDGLLMTMRSPFTTLVKLKHYLPDSSH